MRVDQLAFAPQNVESKLRKQPVQRCRHPADQLLLVRHQLRPVQFRGLPEPDSREPVKRFLVYKRNVKQNLRIAAVVCAGSAEQITLNQRNLFCAPASKAAHRASRHDRSREKLHHTVAYRTLLAF